MWITMATGLVSGMGGMVEDSLGTGDGGQASVSSNTQFTYILAYSTLNTAELLYPKNTFFSFLSFFFKFQVW